MRLTRGILLKFVLLAAIYTLVNLYLKNDRQLQERRIKEVFEKLNIFKRKLALQQLSIEFRRKSFRETKYNASQKVENYINEENVRLRNTDQIVDETILLPETVEQLKAILKCNNQNYLPQRKKICDYWILTNYVRAEHGHIQCHETITYTTHATPDFLANVLTLVKRWNAPVSIAIFAPGTDFVAAVNSIKYIRDCYNTDLIRLWVTFHIFFPIKHMPSEIPDPKTFIKASNCTDIYLPYSKVLHKSYKKEKHLLYPINLARNIAKAAALTHFIFPSDSELYPSPNLTNKFLNMISRNSDQLDNAKSPMVFVVPVFEVEENVSLPMTKTELKVMLSNRLAIPFHKNLCPECHIIPKLEYWIQSNHNGTLEVFSNEKRQSVHDHWEPFYIGTKRDPFYDESFTWEGKYNKMSQAYIMCVMNYDFLILNNAFLVHKPGILKNHMWSNDVWTLSFKQQKRVMSIVGPQYGRVFEWTPGCRL